MSFWGQFGLQEGVSVLGMEVQGLHDYAMFILVIVFSFVGYSMFKISLSSFSGRIYLDKQWLEVVWTLVPFVFLLALGLPSIKLVYLMDEIDLPEVTVKVIGHQWYWSYEYSDFRGSQYGYDSYMISNSSIEGGAYRMLEVDNRCVVSCFLQMRGLVTSDDVVHSWAIPSASVKADGIPGRINQVSLCFVNSGVFYGQCSELCGVNHSFMPICVEAVSGKVFSEWIMGNHNSNMNSGGSKNRGYFMIVGDVVYWVFSIIYEGVYISAKLYVLWWYYFFEYCVVFPVKFALEGVYSLTSMFFKTCVSLVMWVGWFVSDPVGATVGALVFLGDKIFSVVYFSVTSPMKAFVWLVSKACKVAWFVVNFPLFAFDAWIDVMSSFSNNETKQWIVTHIARNTSEFYRAMVEYYSKK
uniref:Cytochrome c oxidase subunit 2 n=2 Tax=Venustaconcha ellipsiformis TaxID=301928 RepID=D2DW05_VENEL|nr:cytochrome c oxidase subunit II [Venustaconcha ellipsiformis]ACQ91033.1 cytochrome c oxidase subunit II [Venustaconcha ellipsiformis]